MSNIPISSNPTTTVPDITYIQIYNRLLSQLPPWFGNQQYVAPPAVGTHTPTTNFNNVMWAFIVSAYESYFQMQYDFLQLRIGQYELEWQSQENIPVVIETENWVTNLGFRVVSNFGQSIIFNETLVPPLVVLEPIYPIA